MKKLLSICGGYGRSQRMAKVKPVSSLSCDKPRRYRTASPAAEDPPLQELRRVAVPLDRREPEGTMLPSKLSDETCPRLDEMTLVHVGAERSTRNAMGPDYGDTNRHRGYDSSQ